MKSTQTYTKSPRCATLLAALFLGGCEHNDSQTVPEAVGADAGVANGYILRHDGTIQPIIVSDTGMVEDDCNN